jgi:antitoxin (DNA-binding transcriptional repressor) of toxin-antitoxin stability system
MKTVTKQEMIEKFDALGSLAHSGETVTVLNAGKPWIKLVPATRLRRGKSAAAFRARLNRISAKPIPGVAEVLGKMRR